MNKRPKSIDGFVLRRHEEPRKPLRNEGERRNISLDDQSQPRKIISPETSDLDEDIESSLEGLDGGDDKKLAQIPADKEESPRIKRGGNRANGELSRKEKRAAKKAEKRSKKHWKLKRNLKWAVIILVLAAISYAVYSVINLANEACKFSGEKSCGIANVIGAVTVNTPLKKDSNGRTNILILGTSDDRHDASDNGGWLTDSIMILSIDQEKHDAYMVSVPRDLWVKYGISCDVGNQGKINAFYQCAGGGQGGVNGDQKALETALPFFSKISGLSLQYGVNVNYTVLEGLVNAVGGQITVDIQSDPISAGGIYDYNTGIKLSNGPNTINAQQALALAKARGDRAPTYGLANSNFDREQNQQRILVGIMNQAKTANLITNIGGMESALSSFGDNVRTTFSLGEIKTLMSIMKDFSPTSLKSINLMSADPAVLTTGMVNGQSVVIPTAGTFDYGDIQAYIAKNVSSDPMVKEGAVVDVLNGSGVSGAAKSVASDLKSASFTVGATGNAPSEITSKVEIHDLSGGKMPGTLAALEKKYGVKANASGSLGGFSSTDNASFVVIVGPNLANSFANN